MGKFVLIFSIFILTIVAIGLMIWFFFILQETRQCTNYPSVFCAEVVCPDGTTAITQ